ncbi:MAG: restriction endonuclease [Anaerolineales bacterium]|nr:restriction endonuclease [Anaerolineales bacterium]
MPRDITENTLFYGDNLPILRDYIGDETVDLIYLDPLFNSNRSYNVLFREETGEEAAAQITAFEDTWHWNQTAEQTYHQLVTLAPEGISRMVAALREFIGPNQMMAYLVMMAARLVELRRVLKPTGSLYLHCDPTASHYLKVVLDTIFGSENFRNEIIWRRADPKGHAFTRYPSTHDVMLFYGNGDNPIWHAQYRGYDEDYLDSHYSNVEEGTGRRYTLSDCTNPNKDRPNLTYEWQGLTRVWRWTKDKMQSLHDAGRLVYTKSGMPRYKRYLDEMQGTPVTTIWDDIPFINSQAAERLGYPTQKPLALLERIINASSNRGDVVLDPFCGCGTAIAAAQKLGRRWIGIDITHLSIALLKYRLAAMFPDAAYRVVGEPEDLPSAEQLAHDDRYQFQWWALSLIKARPLGGQEGSKRGKKGSDRGIDGVITFMDDNSGKPKRALAQVKSGGVKVGDIRDLVGALDREKAAMGIFLTLEPPSRPMLTEAATAGTYQPPVGQRSYPRVQILTVADLLQGAEVKLPPNVSTFKQAQREDGGAVQGKFGL